MITPEVQNTLVTWIFASVAILGIYIVIVVPFLFVWHLLHVLRTPKPNNSRWEQEWEAIEENLRK